MRRLGIGCLTVLLAACGSAPGPGAAGPPRLRAETLRRMPRMYCSTVERTLSLPGRSAERPSVAAREGELAVVWEEAGEGWRGIRLQALDAATTPLGPSVEIATLARPGGDPHIVADGDGYLVLWTEAGPDTSAIQLRRVDRRGKPRGDVLRVASEPAARPLAVARLGSAGALAAGWWTWATDPARLVVSWVDAEGRPEPRPLELEQGRFTTPSMDLQVDGSGRLWAAWEEPVDGELHAVVGPIDSAARSGPAKAGGSSGSDRVGARADLGPSEGPSLGRDEVVSWRPADGTVWRAGLDGSGVKRLGEAHLPDAEPGPDGTVLCWVRTIDDGSDTIECGPLVGGRLAFMERIAAAEYGILAIEVAVDRENWAVAYQREDEEQTQVALAAVSCSKQRRRR